METNVENIFVASETGLLKSVNVESSSWKNLNTVSQVSRDNEITSMCWRDQTQSQICLGIRNSAVLTYECSSGEFTKTLELPKDSGKIKGIATWNDRVVTCAESGELQVWKDAVEQVKIDVGANISKMKQSIQEPNLVCTGGKENDLKLWDLNCPEEAVFKAKNVKNDWLNLRVPVWVTDMAFFSESNKILTGTGHHQVRIYDPNTSQRRPVMDMTFEEYPITSVSLRPGETQVIVGNTHGTMALLDIRKGAEVMRYKGVAGAIRCVQCHPTQPIVASCGLDRYVRIHDINSRELLSKYYLKSRLNGLLLTNEWPGAEGVELPKSNYSHEKKMEVEEHDSGHESEDEVWGEMKVVKTQKLKRKAKHITDEELSEVKLTEENPDSSLLDNDSSLLDNDNSVTTSPHTQKNKKRRKKMKTIDT